MAQLIDKSALVAEIDKCYNESRKMKQVVVSDYWNGKTDAYRCILTLIDNIEVKEVDLEKELDLWMKFNQDDAGYYNTLKLVKHFFELGLKAQKGE